MKTEREMRERLERTEAKYHQLRRVKGREKFTAHVAGELAMIRWVLDESALDAPTSSTAREEEWEK